MAGTKMSGRKGLLAENVRRLRERRALTVPALADLSGTHPAVIYAVERGTRRRLRADMAGRLARALGVGVEELVR